MLPFAPTLGGLQLYWDVEIGEGWRIQEFSMGRAPKRFRLINRFGLKLAQGDLQWCRNARLGRRLRPWPTTDKATVILLHGLGRTRHCFRAMARELERAGYRTLSVAYASSRGRTEDHGQRLVSVLRALPDEGPVFFVCHSFGGLVLRQALADPSLSKFQDRVAATVMLGPPNRGAHLAEVLKDRWWFRWLLSKGGQAVMPEAVAGLPGLAAPFLIVAGVRQRTSGFNPLLPGDDDGIIALSEVELQGAAGIVKVPCAHSFLMNNAMAIAETKVFFSKTYQGRIATGEIVAIKARPPKKQ